MIARALIALIGLYQRSLGRLARGSCRFEPTCSSYGRRAIEVHGAAKGTALALWRILRCGPWSRGGLDQVPPHREARVHG